MLVVTGGTAKHLPRALPVALTFAVSAEHPVARLVWMTLTTQHVGIVELEFLTLEGFQPAFAVQVVAGKTPKSTLTMQAVLQLEIVVRWLKRAWRGITQHPLVAVRAGVHVGIALTGDHLEGRCIYEYRIGRSRRCSEVRPGVLDVAAL